MVAIRGSFGDLLDPRFRKIYYERFAELPSMLQYFFRSEPGSKPQRSEEKFSTVGTFSDFPEFTGTIDYDDLYQGYDTTVTPLEFAKGFSVERTLFDWDQYHIMDQKPRGLATAAHRTREGHGARIFINGFSVDTYFYNNSEGVALCSNSHTTTSGASTASGFDNLVTSALSATALVTARIQMVGFRGDRAERLSVVPSALLIPPNLYETAYEIVASMGKVEAATNNANVHYGQYNIYEWNYLTDTNDWWLMDEAMMKDYLIWLDQIGPEPEFGWIEDFDTMVAKYRAYGRWTNAWIDWRFILGSQVS